MRSRRTLLVLTSLVAVLAGCGGGASQTAETVPSEPLAAEVCVEGKGRDAELYVRNLNDYAWAGEIDFSVEKGGLMYTLLDEGPEVPFGQGEAHPVAAGVRTGGPAFHRGRRLRLERPEVGCGLQPGRDGGKAEVLLRREGRQDYDHRTLRG